MPYLMGNNVNNINKKEFLVAHPTENGSPSNVSRLNWNLGFCGGRKTGAPEALGASMRSQQQCQPTYDAGSRIPTRAALVGGERSDCCAIPDPLNKKDHENKTRSYQTLLGLDDQGEISAFNIEWETLSCFDS